MYLINSIMAAAWFEIRRGITIRRLAISSVLILFPPFMLFLISLAAAGDLPDPNIFICIFTFLIGTLALLLWATPNVYSELESRGWIFLTTRSMGRVAILLGKYLAAICFAWTICMTSVLLCLFMCEAMGSLTISLARAVLVFGGIITLATMSYGAVYSLIGVLFQKKAMVIAAVYTLVSDLVLASFPALISRFTVRFYLQGLSFYWFDIKLPTTDPEFMDQVNLLIGDMSNTLRVVALAGFTFLLLGASVWIIRYREYMTSDED